MRVAGACCLGTWSRCVGHVTPRMMLECFGYKKPAAAGAGRVKGVSVDQARSADLPPVMQEVTKPLPTDGN